MHGSVLGLFLGVLTTPEVEGKRVLEVGALDVNGTVRPMIEARCPAEYIGVDVVDGPGVDQVMDVVDLPRDDEHLLPWDVIVCVETMEHVADPVASLNAMTRVLAPGGTIVITTRSVGFAYHHPPDRWRYTQATFEEAAGRLGLDTLLLCDDPEYPGVFWKARKPRNWVPSPFTTLTADPLPGLTPMAEPLRVLGMPVNPDGTGYYRMWQPFHAMQRAGMSGVVIPPPGRHLFIPTAREVGEFQVVVQQRPGGQAVVDAWEWWSAKTDTALVFETDDLIIDADTSLPHWQDDEIRRTVIRCLDLAHLITVSTEPLADALAVHCRDGYDRIRVIPNRIHADLLNLTAQRDHPFTATGPGRDQVTIGWAGGATHVRDVAMIQDPLRQVLRDQTLGMHWMGDDLSSLVDIGPRSRFTPWQPDVWDYLRAVDFDIGVIPLTRSPFNDCRSPIRAMEWGGLGIPVVASDVPAYRQYVEHGVTGFLAGTPADWREYLGQLVNDPDLRAEMGKAARAKASEWTIQDHWADRADAYKALTAK